MAAPEVVVTRLLSSVTKQFTPDQPRVGAPFRQAAANALIERLAFGDFAFDVQPDRWTGRKGELVVDTRTFALEEVRGNEVELTVTVEGTSDEATAAAGFVWSALGEAAGEATVDLATVSGPVFYSTTAIALLPPYAKLVPVAVEIRDAILPHLEAAGYTSLGVDQGVRLNVGLTMSAGGTMMARPFVIERRVPSEGEEGVYFTVSPLRSDAHIDVLRRLALFAAGAK